MGSQFSDEFLLGYRAGHRDGFADAVKLMRDAVTNHRQRVSLRDREEHLAQLFVPDQTPQGQKNGKGKLADGDVPQALQPARDGWAN